MVHNWRWVLRLMLTLAAVLLCAQRIESETFWGVLQHFPVWIFALPVLLMLLNSLIHAFRVWLLLRDLNGLSYMLVLSAMLRGNFVGLFLPGGGGELARMAWLSQACGDPIEASSAVVVSRVCEMFPWGALMLVAVLSGVSEIDSRLSIAGLFFGIPFCSLLFLMLLFRRLPILERVSWGWFKRLRESSAWRAKGSTLMILVVTGLPFVLINSLCLWLILASIGTGLSYGTTLKIVPIADALISLPISINGIGTRELVFSEILPKLGVSAELAVWCAWIRWTGELLRGLVGGVLIWRNPFSEPGTK